MSLKVQFKTADGSVWQMDEVWVDEWRAEYADAKAEPSRASNFQDYLLDQFFKESYVDWLFPNAHLVEASTEANLLFDLGDIPPVIEGEEYAPYANGYEFGGFVVTGEDQP